MIHITTKEFIFQYADNLRLGPWHVDDSGVWKDGNDQSKIFASKIPVLPVKLMMNEDTGTEKVELAFFKRHKEYKTVVNRSVISNKTQIVRLADSGIEVTSENARQLVLYLSEAITNSLDLLPFTNCKSVLGWTEHDGKKVFLPYCEDISFDEEGTLGYLYSCVSCSGNLFTWTDYMKKLRRSVEVRLAMAASFASPLIELIGQNPFVFHIWGPTGCGKTVALMIAMSIWGDPDSGKLVRTMNMTANAMMATASFLRNIPFAGDELQTIKSAFGNYDKLIMQITEGIDRGRMKFDEVRPTKSWRCSFLFSGEEPCVKASSGGGAKNRAIEVECKDKIIADGNADANFCRENFGYAGRAFTEYAADRIDSIKNIYTSYFNAIVRSCDTTDKQAGAMALMLTADELAKDLFWPDEEYLTLESIQNYIAKSSDVDVSERAYDFVMGLISEHGDNFVNESGNGPSYVTWGMHDGYWNRIYFIQKVLDDEMAKAGFDLTSVKRSWAEKGYILKNKDAFRHLKKINKSVCSCVCFNMPENTEDG